jgi:hypothetical protein
MANRKILLDPSKWVVDQDQKVTLRYRVVTNDLNVRSAFSPVYRIQVPDADEIFDTITNAVTKTVSGDNTVINLTWSTSPVYNNFIYYIFLKKPGESAYSFIKSTETTSFSYVVPTSATGEYSFVVSMPTTTKTVFPDAQLLVAPVTI